MPYVKPEDRARLDAGEPATTAGELNYRVSRLVDDYLRRKGLSYANLNEVVGVLECAKLELYRRVVAGYEDAKCRENTDVYSVLHSRDDRS